MHDAIDEIDAACRSRPHRTAASSWLPLLIEPECRKAAGYLFSFNSNAGGQLAASFHSARTAEGSWLPLLVEDEPRWADGCLFSFNPNGRGQLAASFDAS